jgi:hypothetical protein
MARPEYLMVLPPSKVLTLSRTGYLVRADKRANEYARLQAADLLAETWQVYTAEQLAAAAAPAE